MPKTEPKAPVALDIRVIRNAGVKRIAIFSEGRREDGFDFYLQLLPAIERLSKVAQLKR